MTNETLADLIGPGAMHDFEKATEAERYRIRAWAQKLPDLSDGAFYDLCIEVVTTGTRSESQRATAEEPYIKASACNFQAKQRYMKAGHSSECEGDDLYKEGFNEAGRRFGFSVDEPNPCTCGRNQKG
jgi:hypothetical protein